MNNLRKEDLNNPIKEHLCEECISNQDTSVIETALQKQKLAAPAEHNISYSQAASDCRKQFLGSIFHRASDESIERFCSLSVPLKSIFKINKITSIAALLAVIFCFLCFIGLIASLPLHNNFVSTAMLIGAEASLFFLLMLACTTGNSNSAFLCKTMKTVSDIYISHDGANYTLNKIQECSQRIDCEVFRPSFCKDSKVYEAVVSDKHDVFVLYSDKTKSAVIIDPKL